MPMNERINFDKYLKELQEQGYEILNISGLKFAHKRNMGIRLKEKDLIQYVQKKEPEPQIKQPDTTRNTNNSNKELQNQKKETTPQQEKKEDKDKDKDKEEKKEKNETKQIKKLVIKENFSEKRRTYSNNHQNTKNNTHEESSPVETEENIEPITLKEQYYTPLENWVENDLDENSLPKREIECNEISENELDIKITPSKAQEEQGDSGAHINIKKNEEKETLNADIGPINETPLNYEYFYQLLKTAKRNGIETISFDDIKTKEFATGLLAAALTLNLELENAPKGIDITTQYAKSLPKKVQNKLRSYNQKNGMTIKGKKIRETTNQIRKRKPPKPNSHTSNSMNNPQIIPSQIEYGD